MDSIGKYGDEVTDRLSPDVAAVYPDTNNNNNNTDKMNVTRGDKYSLRPRSMRRPIDDIKSPNVTKSRVCKPKQQPAPLSKYRRKTANARERSRMREINAAFEALRRAVPHLQCAGLPTTTTNEKLTKITTLRLAMKYISALSAALKDSPSDMFRNTNMTARTGSASELGDLLSDCSDLDCFFLESDGESLHLHSDVSDHSITPAEFSTDFPDYSLSMMEFDNSLSPTFTDQSLSPFEPFFSDFT